MAPRRSARTAARKPVLRQSSPSSTSSSSNASEPVVRARVVKKTGNISSATKLARREKHVVALREILQDHEAELEKLQADTSASADFDQHNVNIVIAERDELQAKLDEAEAELSTANAALENANEEAEAWRLAGIEARRMPDYMADDMLALEFQGLFDNIRNWAANLSIIHQPDFEFKKRGRGTKDHWFTAYMPNVLTTTNRPYKIFALCALLGTTWAKHHLEHGPFGPSKSKFMESLNTAASKLQAGSDPAAFKRWLNTTQQLLRQTNDSLVQAMLDQRASDLEKLMLDSITTFTTIDVDDRLRRNIANIVNDARTVSNLLFTHPAVYELWPYEHKKGNDPVFPKFDEGTHEDMNLINVEDIDGFFGVLFPGLFKHYNARGERINRIALKKLKVVTVDPMA
ncbi:hypothetical protein CAC42_4857 [Sphaceloma murrayae]|uniref:Uncharacterized protein n=1 Tax=Sphaceloma murrayae TaxID=2082308 RepID=A0A2K1QPU0_9PEZI|nr:hypothetical protein CAC42_4857 [Sphaceloma murrayae]